MYQVKLKYAFQFLENRRSENIRFEVSIRFLSFLRNQTVNREQKKKKMQFCTLSKSWDSEKIIIASEIGRERERERVFVVGKTPRESL
jgi:hypothetical protein